MNAKKYMHRRPPAELTPAAQTTPPVPRPPPGPDAPGPTPDNLDAKVDELLARRESQTTNGNGAPVQAVMAEAVARPTPGALPAVVVAESSRAVVRTSPVAVHRDLFPGAHAVGRPIPTPAPAPAEPAPVVTPTAVDTATPTLSKNAEFVCLGLAALLALILRFRDPLSSPLIGAEDPYLHMQRTWDLVQGKGVHDYPPGMMILLAPFTILGADAFYFVSRFLPPLLGVTGAVGMYYLARPYLHPVGAVSMALLVAVMPEHIARTNVLFPTAFDLAVMPFYFMAIMKAAEGSRKALYWVGGLTFGFLVTHPWFIALAVLPLGTWALIDFARRPGKAGIAAAVGGATVAAFAGILAALPNFHFLNLLFSRALPRLGELLLHPSTLLPLPEFVHLPTMLTWPLLGLGALGAVIAARRRSRFDLLALLWTAFLFPIALVDWVGLTFIPHRTVVFIGVGLAMLGGIAVSEIARRVRVDGTRTSLPVAASVFAVIALIAVPAAVASPHWYRIYDEDNTAAWDDLDARGTEYVMAGSWEFRAGYRSTTARDCEYYPDFFRDERVRGLVIDQHPNLVVVIDEHTKDPKNGLPTDFLQSWNRIGTWGDIEAYERA